MDAELDDALASAASGPLSARAAAMATVDTLDNSLRFICSSLACEFSETHFAVCNLTSIVAFWDVPCRSPVAAYGHGLWLGAYHNSLDQVSYCAPRWSLSSAARRLQLVVCMTEHRASVLPRHTGCCSWMHAEHEKAP